MARVIYALQLGDHLRCDGSPTQDTVGFLSVIGVLFGAVEVPLRPVEVPHPILPCGSPTPHLTLWKSHTVERVRDSH